MNYYLLKLMYKLFSRQPIFIVCNPVQHEGDPITVIEMTSDWDLARRTVRDVRSNGRRPILLFGITGDNL